MSNQSQMQQRQEDLHKDVLTVLKKFPGGIPKDQIWQYVLKYTKCHVSAKKYGVSKMSDILVWWQEIETVEEEGKPTVLRLKEEAKFDKYFNRVTSKDWTPSYLLPGPKDTPIQQQPSSGISLNTSSFMTRQVVKSHRPLMASPETNDSLRMSLPPEANMVSVVGGSEKQKRQPPGASRASSTGGSEEQKRHESEPQAYGNPSFHSQIPGAAGTNTSLGQIDADIWCEQPIKKSLLGQPSISPLSRKEMCSQTKRPLLCLPSSVQESGIQQPLYLYSPSQIQSNIPVKNPAVASTVVAEDATHAKTEIKEIASDSSRTSECNESTAKISSQDRNGAQDSDVCTNKSRKFWGISWPVEISENVFKDNLAYILKQFPEGLDQSSLVKRYKERYNFEIIPEQFGLKDLSDLWMYMSSVIQFKYGHKLKCYLNPSYYAIRKTLQEQPPVRNNASISDTPQQQQSCLKLAQESRGVRAGGSISGISWPVGISENEFKGNLVAILKQFPEGLRENKLIKEYKEKYGFKITPNCFGLKDLSGLWNYMASTIKFKRDRKLKLRYNPDYRSVKGNLQDQPTLKHDASCLKTSKDESDLQAEESASQSHVHTEGTSSFQLLRHSFQQINISVPEPRLSQLQPVSVVELHKNPAVGHKTKLESRISWPPELSEEEFRQNLADILKNYPSGLKQSNLLDIYKQRHNFCIVPEKFGLKNLCSLWKYLKTVVKFKQGKKLKLCLNPSYKVVGYSLGGQLTLKKGTLHSQVSQEPSTSEMKKDGLLTFQSHQQMNIPVPEPFQKHPIPVLELYDSPTQRQIGSPSSGIMWPPEEELTDVSNIYQDTLQQMNILVPEPKSIQEHPNSESHEKFAIGEQSSMSSGIIWPPEVTEEDFKHNLADILNNYPDGMKESDLISMYKQRYSLDIVPLKFGLSDLLSLWIHLKSVIKMKYGNDLKLCLNSDYKNKHLDEEPTQKKHVSYFPVQQQTLASEMMKDGLTKEEQDMDLFNQSCAPITKPKVPQLHPESRVLSSVKSENMDYLSIPVKPFEKKLFEQKEITCSVVYRPMKGNPRHDDMEKIAKECIDILAEANEYVSPERIEKLLIQRYQVNKLNELGLRHLDQLQCIHEHNRTLSRVNAYIQSFIKTRSLCTLYELSECLREFVPNKEEFLHLKLGPIQRLPVVFENFKFPPDQAVVPEITSIDIIEHFRNYLTKTQKWTSALELEDFMNYLVGQYMAENAYYLGVRIHSMPLMTQVLKKAQRDAAGKRREIFAKFQDDLMSEIKASFDRFKWSILKDSSDGDEEIQKHYLKLQPESAIKEIVSKFHVLLSLQPSSSRKRKKYSKIANLKNAILQFIKAMNKDKVAKLLFHIAICISDTTLQEEAKHFMTHLSEKEDARQKETNQQLQKPPPRKDELGKKLKEYLEKCVARGTLTLTLLDRIEEKLLEDFDFTSFSDMKQGRFLYFLLSEAKQILEENGGITVGSSSGSDEQGFYRHQQTDLLEFIKQANHAGLTQLPQLEVALCNQFHVKEVQHLGHGNISRLQTAADKPGKHPTRDFTIFYEAAQVPNSGSLSQSTLQVGILGHQSREAALSCLHNCPLLEDIAEWSHWKLVFEPEHGRLKDFIQKYGGTRTLNLEGRRIAIIDILALETQPGHLIKLTNNASEELFAQALEQKNVLLTSGQLVSLVATKKGINNLPVALLANHVKSALMQMHAADPQCMTPGGPPGSASSSSHSASHFVLQCLVKIPFHICVAVANKIFLEPLGQVVGSTKSKVLLMELSKSPWKQNRLEELGCLLGIAEWIRPLEQKGLIPPSQIQILPAEMVELFEEEIVSFSTSEEETDDEDSSSVVLSDLSDEELELLDPKDSCKDHQGEASDSSEKVVLVKDSQGIMKYELLRRTMTPGMMTQVNQSLEEDEERQEPSTEAAENLDTETDGSSSFISDIIDKNENVFEEVKGEELENFTVDPEEKTKEEEDPNVSLINQIRRDEFGIGVELNEDGKRLMQVQQERLGRSLDRLTRDLYSKDTHFVLELVQNADDNTYPDEILSSESDICPSAKFIIDEKFIIVLNNECGFSEKDIRALCDVGRSTKGKHKYGYIGQKGIGFKSVFRVTDCPEVHSNGYHIRFDVNDGPMGYILPNWVTEDQWETEQGWVTKIVLPLKEEMQIQSRTLGARFNDIHPSLLLFLHRLREMTIDNKIEGQVQTMRRCDLGNGVVEIKHSDGSDRWLVIKKMLDASKISSQVKSGAEVDSTEIAVAFPLLSKDQRTSGYVLPPKQPVFAFLPLRSYGFRFIIQGDFDMPSSREDVDRDSPWNQWLRSEIHNLFLESLEVFKTHPGFSQIEALSAFLQFVPMEDEILDFFRPVAIEILKKLKGIPCVPTEPNSRGNIMWKIPSQTVRVRDKLVHRVITPELLQKHLNLYYLHSDVAAMLNPTLTQCLGIEMLSTEHLIEIGKTMIQNIEGVCGDEDILNISYWLACIYRSMDEFQFNEDYIKLLQDLKIIPLSDGSLIALTEKIVFFPVIGIQQEGKEQNDYRQILQQDLHSIHDALVKTSDDEINSQVHKLLLKLGVKQITPDEVIHHHILPVLKSQKWKEKAREILVRYIVFIKEHTDHNPSLCNLEELKEVAQLVTNHGVLNPVEQPIHFTPLYGSKVNLERTFQGYDWILLDGCYLMNSSNQLDVHRWHDFFIKLGVTDFLDVKKEEVHLDANTLSDSSWAPLKDLWPKSSEYVIQDFTCKELTALILTNKFFDGPVYQQQMRDLCEFLDHEWDNKYSRYTVTQVCDSSGSRLRETETSISIALRTLTWLPARRTKLTPQRNGEVLVSTEVLMMQPSSLYIRSPLVEKLAGHNVLYVEATLSPESSFSQFLRLKNSLDIETVKNFLLEWSARTIVDEPAVFCTSLQHMKNVYSYLYSELSHKQVQDLFRDNPVIFVPDRNVSFSLQSDIVAGKMLSRLEIWIEDRTGLFDKYRSLLEEFYSEICKKRTVSHYYIDKTDILELFSREMNINHQPQAMEYAELLTLITGVYSAKDPKILPDIFHIYSVIGRLLSSAPEGMDQFTAQMVLKTNKENMGKYLRKQKVLISKCNVWVCPDDFPMIADNLEWEKMFKDKETVCFLQIEEKMAQQLIRGRNISGRSEEYNKEMVQLFLEICGVKKLSECVEMHHTTELVQECPQLQLYIHQIISTLQQYLASRYPSIYQTHDKMKDVLKDSRFFQVEKLEVVYSLRNHPSVIEIRQEKCIIKPPVFYVQKDHVESIPEINRELARVFSQRNPECNTALRSFLLELHSIVKGGTEDTVEDLLQRHGVDIKADPIPEEELWDVPELDIQIIEVNQDEEEPDKTPEIDDEPQENKTSIEGEPVLRAWPPKAKHDGAKARNNKEDKAGSNMFWPPRVPDYMKSTKELPSHFKVAAPQLPRSQRFHRPQETQLAHHESLPSHRESGIFQQDSHPNSHHCSGQDSKKKVRVYYKNQGAIGRSKTKEEQIEEQEPKPIMTEGITDWTPLAGDYSYDELPSMENLLLPEMIGGNEEVGRWGEHLVYSYLMKVKDTDSTIQEVKWINEEGESGAPYDLEVHYIIQNEPQIHYIEVKSTQSNNKEVFEISLLQIKFAERQKEHFQIYRVFNAGNSQLVRLIRISNLDMKLEQRQVRLCMLL
ncbi:hypothetical protein ACJMK2_009715 [Sinanodonta woodiana]|uniref:HTH OST-type domain-containing protein n=1 Tax=Sinanodonta woodiana TaxID=1069815 RepID=A0ABD3VEB4_SINWO